MMLAALDGNEGVLHHVLHALIAGIGKHPCAFFEAHFRLQQQSPVMTAAFFPGGADDFPALAIGHQLLFQRVAFLFARVELALFFWGRSIGVSVASTTTT